MTLRFSKKRVYVLLSSLFSTGGGIYDAYEPYFDFEDWDASENKTEGGTIPSFRNVLAMEKKEWKPFRDALDMKAKKMFD